MHIMYVVIHCLQSELTLEAHLAALQSRHNPPALTFAEQEMADIKQKLAGANAGVDDKHATMKSIGFPLSADAQQAVAAFRSGLVSYAQLGVDEGRARAWCCTAETSSRSASRHYARSFPSKLAATTCFVSRTASASRTAPATCSSTRFQAIVRS